MQIINEALLDRFRQRRCEWCHAGPPCQPHHLLTRGMGGGGRIDHPWNLIGLCHYCHRSHHDGNAPLTCDLLAMVAAREAVSQEDIIVEMGRIRRADKSANQGEGSPAAGDRGPDEEGGDYPAIRPSVPGQSSRDRPAGMETDQGGWSPL